MTENVFHIVFVILVVREMARIEFEKLTLSSSISNATKVEVSVHQMMFTFEANVRTSFAT